MSPWRSASVQPRITATSSLAAGRRVGTPVEPAGVCFGAGGVFGGFGSEPQALTTSARPASRHVHRGTSA